jgi:hypothetical protein
MVSLDQALPRIFSATSFNLEGGDMMMVGEKNGWGRGTWSFEAFE